MADEASHLLSEVKIEIDVAEEPEEGLIRDVFSGESVKSEPAAPEASHHGACENIKAEPSAPQHTAQQVMCKNIKAESIADAEHSDGFDGLADVTVKFEPVECSLQQEKQASSPSPVRQEGKAVTLTDCCERESACEAASGKTALGNIQSAPENIQSAPENIQSAPGNIQSAPENIQSAPENIQSAPGNIQSASTHSPSPHRTAVLISHGNTDPTPVSVMSVVIPHRCHLCPSAFMQASSLRMHMESCHGQKRQRSQLSLSDCGNDILSAGNRECEPGPARQHVCDVCSKTFTRADDLKTHIDLIHRDQWPFVCDVCSKGFPLACILKTHKLIHTSERPFVCDVCKKGFNRSANLKQHKLIHAADRPFVCSVFDNSPSMSSSEVEYQSDLSHAAEDLEAQLAEESQAIPSPQSGRGGKSKPRKAPRRCGLTKEQKEEIVEFLREKPYMYSKTHSLFKDGAARKREWKELAARLGVKHEVVKTWYRSMRTMLARVKKARTKSGSGVVKLSYSFQWVWDKLGFMAPFIETLETDTMGRKRKACGPAPDLRSQPEVEPLAQPGPSWKVPRKTDVSTASAPATAPPAGSSTISSVSSCTSDCCGKMRDDFSTCINRAENHQSQFWGYLQWKTSNFTAELRRGMEKEVMGVVMNWCDLANPATPEPLPQRVLRGPTMHSGGCFETPQPSGRQAIQQQVAGPSSDLDTFLDNVSDSPMPRLSPRKSSTLRLLPQAGMSTVCQVTGQEMGITFLDEDDG